MKKVLSYLSLLGLSLLFIFLPSVQASSLLDSIVENSGGQIIFQNPEVDGQYRELPNFPIQVSLEQLDTDQPQIRMVWNLDDASKDEVMPIEIEEIEPTEVPVLPDGESYQSTIAITIPDPPRDYYQGTIYLTDLASMGGVQMLIPNYAGNVEESQQGYYQVLSEVIPDNSADLNIADLDQAMAVWQENMGQEYIRYYPQDDQAVVNSFSQEVLTHMAFEGEPIDLNNAEGYRLHAIYSTIGTDSYNQVGPITYVMVDVEGTPQVWVSQDSQRNETFNFKLTENVDIKDVFGQWYYQADAE
ncbi:DUF4767 domain-containing protein [Ignavigranum ruoffiae]|uniref:DUF4767 domain-containing protein n=1 Tax=Ignavigranum ruoffiae TaxID=89093 RepID=UPI0024ACEBC3|nr:DUF4767 domain-containing protein [Ignavigranum ruoffiae]